MIEPGGPAPDLRPADHDELVLAALREAATA